MCFFIKNNAFMLKEKGGNMLLINKILLKILCGDEFVMQINDSFCKTYY